MADLDTNSGQHFKDNKEFGFITIEMLEKALQTRCSMGITVNGFKLSAVDETGEHFGSVVVAVTVDAIVGTDPKTFRLIIKTTPQNKYISDLLIKTSNTFQKEIQAYSVVFPSLVKFQYDVTVEPVVPSIVDFYHGEVNYGNSSAFIVLDDIRQYGYTQVDLKEGVDVQHCRLAMVEIARLHALSFALKNGNRDNFKKFDCIFQDSQFIDEIKPMHEKLMKLSTKQSASMILSAFDNDVAEKKIERLLNQDMHDYMFSYLKPKEPFSVICHGDFWCGNILFKHEMVDGCDVPVDVKIIDHQIMRYCPPTADLIQFFYTSTTGDVRKKHLDDLLLLYHETFVCVLDHVKVSCPQFTLKVLKDMFYESILYGLCVACTTVPMLMGLRLPECDDTDMNKLSDSLLLDAFQDQFEELTESSRNLIRDRLVGAFQDALDYGAL